MMSQPSRDSSVAGDGSQGDFERHPGSDRGGVLLRIPRHKFVAALLAALWVSPASAQEGGGTLGPGDAVQVEVWRQPELSGEFMIAQDGTIMHPLYQGISVVGLDFAAIEERLGAVIGQYETQPRFVMQPLLRISVGGEVRQPNLYRLPPPTSIAEAIAQAGGISERGDLEEIRLFRDGRELVIDMTDADLRLAEQAIRSGDQIIVARRVSVFRDYIAPAGSLIAAAVSIVNIIISN